MRPPNPHLSDTEEKLCNKLHNNLDVKISVLFRALRGRWPLPTETRRIQQQHLGKTISRANVKLRLQGFQIIPGMARGTYRLVKLQK